MKRGLLSFGCLIATGFYFAQHSSITGQITGGGILKPAVGVDLEGTDYSTFSDSSGVFRFSEIPSGHYKVRVKLNDFQPFYKEVVIKENDSLTLDINLKATDRGSDIEDVVITGTLKSVRRSDSPVTIEVYSPAYFKKNPTPNIFDALQNVNGVRPQLNCNICSTGDIHINGLEGPYTMVLIDGMPIVSSLGTVYGMSGIPNSLVERIEIVKGPASSLYGSEAVGGLINVITNNPHTAPLFSADLFSTTWGEYNLDVGFKFNAGKKAKVLTGINYFNYQNKIDNNHDNFTDVTLQDRISLFQKWNFQRKENRLFSIATRYMYEERWGGDMRWNKSYRGGDEIYGESIYTSRTEFFGSYQLPVNEKIFLGFSFVNHDQDSRYGETSYIANQKIAFSQLNWDKKAGNHDLLFGAAMRYTYYDDNTAGTSTILGENKPEKTYLPGVFIQDEIRLAENHQLLLGFRYDYNNIHRNIFTPRMAYKWSVDQNNILRLNAGTGFRVVNLFTEDHAALTGARNVVVLNDLKPEKSYNINLNYTKKMYFGSGSHIALDASAFYTYFTNRIVPDYETNTSQIIYDNIGGNAVSKGFSLNANLNFANGLKFIMGGTAMENTITDNGITEHQILTEKFMGIWAVSYKIRAWKTAIDYTGNISSLMRLPLLGQLDPRKRYSPWWSIQNIQFTYEGFQKFEIYAGVKNILNWTPNKGTPFIISRANDPFNKQVKFDSSGQVVATPDNPYALTFDPNYVYAPNQGIRSFLGVRFTFK
ncbi:TonB-dependent receptor [Chryseobacterium salivictor]|uniref:Colicin I receptor n=1 Tax=Chryseobacterium salivictor TaxID=2547600 RepID=A0A4P6ZCF4_9FLAO|nr:TonB-dependent receptor [Chryseobacterium salivictor]QBO57012.1 Colicin I receptor [Chryseobacterium salivictor]